MSEHDNIAIFKGEQLNPPVDLFIPPDAFEIWLDQFEGPLDLLLHIIRKNNFDILDIPISDITTQYMSYIDYLEEERFELASEYLVMAAWLAEIKSRILLPTPEVDDSDEEIDPRQELIRRLQIYAQYKEVAIQLSEREIFYRDIFPISPDTPNIVVETPEPTIELSQLLNALEKIIARADLHQKHQIKSEKISINDRIDQIITRLTPEKPIAFTELIDPAEGRYGITISFLSLLELARKQQILLTQEEAYSDILIALATE